MFKVRMKVGGNVFDVTEKLLKHSEAEVIEVDAKGEFKRLVDSTEWQREGFFDIPKVEEPKVEERPKAAPKKKAAKKKASKKKAENKPEAAIPDAPALENIDVSEL